MSDNSSLDVGKVISVLMENPALIAEISSLVKKDAPSEPTEAATVVNEEKSDAKEAIAPLNLPQGNALRGNRTQLLGALKPYLSEPRARAIDSMMTIADIIDMMKTR